LKTDVQIKVILKQLCIQMSLKTEKTIIPGANPIKKIWSKFTHSFCKLDHCSSMGKKGTYTKWSSLPKGE
jgi:hypothetical protein